MSVMPLSPEAPPQQKVETRLEHLAEHVAEAIRDDGATDTPEGLRLFRGSSATEPEHGVSYPALCLVVQGGKEVVLGDDCYRYDANHYLITASALPIESRIIEASAEKPCLGVVIRLDPAVVGSVILETMRPAQRSPASVRAFSVSPMDEELLDAVLRLIKLEGVSAGEAHFLRPLVMREIIFRLLKGEQGGWLRHTAALGLSRHRIAEALDRLRTDFSQPLRIEELAQDAGMSVSSFHHHFKTVTAMSPMQFQKRMRLQEARRLMLYENFDAARAGFNVGYEDTSHFSREYKRHFGHPPRRDVQRIRESGSAVVG
jgi:AraC-like DNA-binding protein